MLIGQISGIFLVRHNTLHLALNNNKHLCPLCVLCQPSHKRGLSAMHAGDYVNFWHFSLIACIDISHSTPLSPQNTIHLYSSATFQLCILSIDLQNIAKILKLAVAWLNYCYHGGYLIQAENNKAEPKEPKSFTMFTFSSVILLLQVYYQRKLQTSFLVAALRSFSEPSILINYNMHIIYTY